MNIPVLDGWLIRKVRPKLVLKSFHHPAQIRLAILENVTWADTCGNHPSYIKVETFLSLLQSKLPFFSVSNETVAFFLSRNPELICLDEFKEITNWNNGYISVIFRTKGRIPYITLDLRVKDGQIKVERIDWDYDYRYRVIMHPFSVTKLVGYVMF